MLEKFRSLEFRTQFLVCVFVASVITSNIIGGKVSEIGLFGLPVIFSVGIIPFFMTFFILDTINEVHGQQKARETVWLAMFTQAFIFLVILAALALPYAERSWVKAPEFTAVFGMSIRIIIASLAAFFLADMSDTYIFARLRERTKGKMLWLRSNISNFIGETIDTFVFMFLAFFDPATGRGVSFVIALTLPYLALKFALSVINTPFVYAGVAWLRGGGQASK
ncbi:MAG: queuosine precursor transporter [Candidatus Diapherotrites archaeon]|uniref:Probable queuosine precursor transporter n=1 Tax=Candidatus Iainarchaeum sp. TaxID=3101447 RepID=A0A8T3YNX3_9ARCH|nr:queuosine precursor transporter [Candidatus Diapherotrites archaeon]